MIKVNSNPKIIIHNYDKSKIKYVFSPFFNKDYPSGQNLLAYSFQRSINNFSSAWNLSYKDSGIKETKEQVLSFDLIEPLDVIEIKEFDKTVYIGVITDISFSAKSNGAKIVNLSGKGIEFLFEYLTLSLDVTAMSFLGEAFQTEYQNINVKLTVNEKEAVKVKDSFSILFDCFSEAVNKHKKLSNSHILTMIKTWYGNNYLEIDDNLKFEYPISSNLFTNSTINFIGYIKNLLPETVYEMFSIIKDEKPKLVIREKPFSYENWKKLKDKQINNPITIYSSNLTDYLLSKSINEVYTAFYSYVEGSIKSAEYYQRLYSTEDGNGSLINIDKLNKYGYKPLIVNFIGFNTAVDNPNINFEDLNKKIREWYENLDEMFNLTLTIIKLGEEGIIGNIVNFLNGEFYLFGVDHQWQYGDSVRLTYHCERGGDYSSGSFKPLKNVTKRMLEIKDYSMDENII